MGLKAATAAIVFAVQVYLARLLGHRAFGEYAYAFAWLQFVFILARGGLDTASLRYAAQYRAQAEFPYLSGFLRRSFQSTFFQSSAAGLLMIAVTVAARSHLSEGAFISLIVAGATVPPLAHMALSSATIRGLGNVLLSMAADLMRPLLFLVLLLVTCLPWGIRPSPGWAMGLHLAATTCTFAFIFRQQHRLQRDLIHGFPPQFLNREWHGTGMYLMVATGLAYFQGRTGVVVSGVLLGPAAAGTYSAIERLADAVLLGLAAVDLIGAPKFAELYAQGRRADLQHYSRLLAWGASVYMAGAVLFLVVFGKPVLRLFGDGFVSAYPALLILLAGTAVNSMTGSAYYLLNMTGHHRVLMGILVVSLCVNVALSAVLVPRYGIIGTACANAGAVVMWNVCMVTAVRGCLGIWPNIGRLNSTGAV